MNNSQQNYRKPFYAWLTVTGLVIFGAFLLWQSGLAGRAMADDKTYISLVIMLLLGITITYLGVAAWKLSQLNHSIVALTSGTRVSALSGGTAAAWLTEHIQLTRNSSSQDNPLGESLQARLVERIHRGHSLGWFVSDMLIRLGLIGTVIGFILMLQSVYQLQSGDISALQDLLGSMGVGMQVALYTTLSGISASLILGIYCKILDRHADSLIGNIILYTATDQSAGTASPDSG